jgi:protein-tyrosine phosphatase
LVIDLRWKREIDHAPSVFASSSRVRYQHIPLLDHSPPETDTSEEVYRRMIDDGGQQIAQVVRSLIGPGGFPAVVGCAAGKDRTGVTIAVILGAVGVPRQTVIADYVVSSGHLSPKASHADLADWVRRDSTLMAQTLDYVDTRYGGPRALLMRKGLSPKELDRLTDLLVEIRG